MTVSEIRRTHCFVLEWTRIEDGWSCHYHYNLPVGKYDVRNETSDGVGPGFLKLTIAETNCNGDVEAEAPVEFGTDRLRSPFRDGSHACWDSYRSKLPAYIVFGEKYRTVEPEKPALDPYL